MIREPAQATVVVRLGAERYAANRWLTVERWLDVRTARDTARVCEEQLVLEYTLGTLESSRRQADAFVASAMEGCASEVYALIDAACGSE